MAWLNLRCHSASLSLVSRKTHLDHICSSCKDFGYDPSLALDSAEVYENIEAPKRKKVGLSDPENRARRARCSTVSIHPLYNVGLRVWHERYHVRWRSCASG